MRKTAYQLAEGEQQTIVRRLQRRIFIRFALGDSRQAILLVAVGDIDDFSIGF